MLRTWSKIDIPPKPSKNAQIIMFKEIFFIGILEIIETPFVSSTMPDNIPDEKLLGILKILRNGERILDNISNIPVCLSIDIITLKSITNPPIITTVVIEVIILFCKIPPSELNFGGVFLFVSEKDDIIFLSSPKITFPKSK